MRTKVIFIIIFLLTMAFLPIIISKCSSPQTAVTSNSTADKTSEPATANEPSKSETAVETTTESAVKENSETEKSLLSESDLCGMVAAKYNENYCEETLKALAVILYTDYNVSPDDYDLSDIDICLPESKAENSVKENYNKIKSAVSSVYKKTLCADGKAFYIPFCDFTNGKTSTNSEYPYLTAVASPWDSYVNTEEKDYYGVSLNGINFLCNDGYNYEEALRWYLPNFKIQILFQ